MIVNCVLLNYYLTGRDHMSWHADNEQSLGKNPLIISFSLGEMRRFQFRGQKNWAKCPRDPHNYSRKRISYPVDLTHGSILVMGGETQSHWDHILRGTAIMCGPRINLTFRLSSDKCG